MNQDKLILTGSAGIADRENLEKIIANLHLDVTVDLPGNQKFKFVPNLIARSNQSNSRLFYLFFL
jgi:hypothetical protein